jgi:hypothetical protein
VRLHREDDALVVDVHAHRLGEVGRERLPDII